MGIFQNLQKAYPLTLRSFGETGDALLGGSEKYGSSFMSDWAGVGALIGAGGGLLGTLGIGIAAFIAAGTGPGLIGAITLGFVSVGGSLAGCVVGAVAGGLAATPFILALGVMNTITSFMQDAEDQIKENNTSRTKDLAGKAFKVGMKIGAVAGLGLAGMSLAAAPSLMGVLGLVTGPVFGGLVIGTAVAAGAGSFSIAANALDRVQGKEPSTLTGAQEKQLRAMAATRGARLQSESYNRHESRHDAIPSFTEAVPTEIYEKLSDNGKLQILEGLKSIRYNNWQSDKQATFNRFADDARHILAQETRLEREASPHQRKMTAMLERKIIEPASGP